MQAAVGEWGFAQCAGAALRGTVALGFARVNVRYCTSDGFVAALEPRGNAAVPGACATPMLAEAVGAVAATRSRAFWDAARFRMRGRMHGFAGAVPIRAVIVEIGFVGLGRGG